MYKEKAVKTLVAITMVGLLLFAAPVQWARAKPICTPETILCMAITEPRYRGMGDLATADVASGAAARQRANEAYAVRLTGQANDYLEARELARLRANQAYAARYTGMAADYFAAQAVRPLTGDPATMNRDRGVAVLAAR